MPIQFYNEKILFEGGKIAMHEDCCCGGGEPCSYCQSGTMPQYLVLTIKLVDLDCSISIYKVCAMCGDEYTLVLPRTGLCTWSQTFSGFSTCSPSTCVLHAYAEYGPTGLIVGITFGTSPFQSEISANEGGTSEDYDCSRTVVLTNIMQDPTRVFCRAVASITVSAAAAASQSSDLSVLCDAPWFPFCGCNCNLDENGIPGPFRTFEFYTTGNCILDCPGMIEFSNDAADCEFNEGTYSANGDDCTCPDPSGTGRVLRLHVLVECSSGVFYIGFLVDYACSGIGEMYLRTRPDELAVWPLDCTEDVEVPVRGYSGGNYGPTICGYVVIPACVEEEE